MFLNLSFIKYYSMLPAFSLTISLIETNGLMSSKALGWRSDAKRLAGPEPIDLPNKSIDFSGILYTIVR